MSDLSPLEIGSVTSGVASGDLRNRQSSLASLSSLRIRRDFRGSTGDTGDSEDRVLVTSSLDYLTGIEDAFGPHLRVGFKPNPRLRSRLKFRRRLILRLPGQSGATLPTRSGGSRAAGHAVSRFA